VKSDLDALMKERNLDALMIFGNAAHNPLMYYFVGGSHVNQALLFKKQNEPAVLFCGAMERDEAAKSGLKVMPVGKGVFEEFRDVATLIFEANKIALGRVALYGTMDVGTTIVLLNVLRSVAPEVEFVGEWKNSSLLLYAMETKDDVEVAHIRQMGAVTTKVVGMVHDLLTSSDVREDEILLKEDGSPLTIGDVKGKISLWLAEHGAVDSEGLIFAIGRDAGVPHSAGNPDEPISLGKTIVFDIFPNGKGGGYFYDFTRTWSLGYANPEAQAMYDQVHEIYDKLIENLDLNADFRAYQKMTCEYFESKGHKTPMNTEGVLEEGYVHSLGHGVGLNIHERPLSRHTAADDNVLKSGVVVTIEPGLYYPEKGMGFRIEDTYWVRPDGQFERLAEYPYDFVLPMKKWKK